MVRFEGFDPNENRRERRKDAALIGSSIGGAIDSHRKKKRKKEQREFLKKQGGDRFGFNLLDDPEVGIKELASQKFKAANSARTRAQTIEDRKTKRENDFEDFKKQESFKNDLKLGVFEFEEEIRHANQVAMANHNHKLQLERQKQQFSQQVTNQKEMASFNSKLTAANTSASQSQQGLISTVQKSKLDPGEKAKMITEVRDTGGLSEQSIQRLKHSKRRTAPKPGVDSTSGDPELDGKIDSIIGG